MSWLWDALSKNPFGAGSFLFGMGSFLVALTVLMVFQWWRQRKSLSYRLLSQETVADVNKHFSGRVEVIFDGKPVKRVHIIVIELMNDGWVPVDAQDFFEPISIFFGKDAKLMVAEVVKCHPEALKVEIIEQPERLSIKPLLLNRGDRIRLKALVDNYSRALRVDGRIKGVPSIKNHPPSPDFPPIVHIGMLLVAILLFIAMFFRYGVSAGVIVSYDLSAAALTIMLAIIAFLIMRNR